MPFTPTYQEAVPTREEIDQTPGQQIVEFGANWCGHCQGLNPTVENLLSAADDVQHIRVADGKGKSLGRSFQVKLWPTLVLIQDGSVVAQLVRPSPQQLTAAFEKFREA